MSQILISLSSRLGFGFHPEKMRSLLWLVLVAPSLLDPSFSCESNLEAKCQDQASVSWTHGDPSLFPQPSGAFLACGTQGLTLYVESPDSATRVTFQAVDANTNEPLQPVASELDDSLRCSKTFTYPSPAFPLITIDGGGPVVLEPTFVIPDRLPIAPFEEFVYDDDESQSKGGESVELKSIGGITFNFDECGIEASVENGGFVAAYRASVLVKEQLYLDGVVQKRRDTLIQVRCALVVAQPEASTVQPTIKPERLGVCRNSTYSLSSVASGNRLVNTLTQLTHPTEDTTLGFKLHQLSYAESELIVDNGELTRLGETLSGNVMQTPQLPWNPLIKSYEVHTDLVSTASDEHSLEIAAKLRYCFSPSFSHHSTHVCQGATLC